MGTTCNGFKRVLALFPLLQSIFEQWDLYVRAQSVDIRKDRNYQSPP